MISVGLVCYEFVGNSNGEYLMLRRDFIKAICGSVAAFAVWPWRKTSSNAFRPDAKLDSPFPLKPGKTVLPNGWVREVRAGTFIQKGEMCYIGDDGKAYPFPVTIHWNGLDWWIDGEWVVSSDPSRRWSPRAWYMPERASKSMPVKLYFNEFDWLMCECEDGSVFGMIPHAGGDFGTTVVHKGYMLA